MELDHYDSIQMQDSQLVHRKRVAVNNSKPAVLVVNRSSRSMTALKLCSSAEIADDVASISLLDETVRGENCFFKPISSKVYF